jgi:hypothetical protein
MVAGFWKAPIDWILLVVGIMAGGLTWYGLRQAILDHGFQIATEMNDPVRALAAEMNQRGEGFRLMKCIVIVFAALLAATAQTPERRATILGWAFIMIAIIMSIHSFLDRMTRLKTAKTTAEAHPVDPVTGRKIAQKGGELGGNVATFEPLEADDRRTANGDRRS